MAIRASSSSWSRSSLASPSPSCSQRGAARKREAVAFLERFDKAITTAVEAINTVVDKRTSTVMVDALQGNFDVYIERIRLLEQECRRIRVAIESAMATDSALKENLI